MNIFDRSVNALRFLLKMLFLVFLVAVLIVSFGLLIIGVLLVVLYGIDALLSNPLFPIIIHVISVSGPWIVVATGIYTLYRTWLKGPNIQMISEQVGGTGPGTYQTIPLNVITSWISPHVDVIFFNDGSRAGVIKELTRRFDPTSKLKEFLAESQKIHVIIKSITKTYETDFPDAPFHIEEKESISIRLKAPLRLNIKSDEAVNAWVAFLKKQPLLGYFLFSAKRLNRKGQFLPFPEKKVPVYPSKELIETFSNPPKQ